MRYVDLKTSKNDRKTPPKGIYTDRYENNGMRSELWAVGGSNTTPDPNLAC